jgi:hypothetical protein
VTVVLIDIVTADTDLAKARTHRPGGEDVCRECGWHWPCPAFFAARRALIRAGVPPVYWAQ